MDTHIKVVGILNIILGALGVVVGLGFLAVFGGLAGLAGMQSHEEDAMVGVGILGVIGIGIFFFALLVSLPSVLGGWGVLNYKEWARILMIVLSALNLLNIPFGTALGAYSLWVLLNGQTAQMFQQRRALY